VLHYTTELFVNRLLHAVGMLQPPRSCALYRQAIEDLVVQMVFNVYSSTSPENVDTLVKVMTGIQSTDEEF
jgi:hypothetical protein